MMKYLKKFENKIVDAYIANSKKSYAVSQYGFGCYNILEILKNENDTQNILIRKIYFYDNIKFTKKYENLGFFNYELLKQSGIILYESNEIEDCKNFLLITNKYNL